MAREENFARTGKRDPATTAELVEITVKVKDKDCIGTRRLFTSREQVMKLDDAALLKRVNYAEDLLVRAATTRENTDQTGKRAMRQAAMDAWKKADRNGFVQWFVEESHTEAERNARLEKYYADYLVDTGL